MLAISFYFRLCNISLSLLGNLLYFPKTQSLLQMAKQEERAVLLSQRKQSFSRVSHNGKGLQWVKVVKGQWVERSLKINISPPCSAK